MEAAAAGVEEIMVRRGVSAIITVRRKWCVGAPVKSFSFHQLYRQLCGP